MLLNTGCSSNTTQPTPNLIPSQEESTVQINQSKPKESGIIEEQEQQPSQNDIAQDEEVDDFEEFDEFEEEFGDAEENQVWDPLGGYNRVMTSFNDVLLLWILEPVAKCYRWILPEFIRRGIANMFTNILYPVRLVNNLLQLKFKNAGEETIRFVTNSTVGILGFWDPAKEWGGFEAHDEDFGQTLGFYGVGPGPHFVLPFFGPRNLRDALSMYPDTYYFDPKTEYVEGIERQVAVFVLENVNKTSFRIGEYESLKRDAIDFYPFLRDSYEQMRQKEIEE
ncbi:VacJ family lipoprotein [bacterium]|nr:VacJ family lipoprotein [bacterium]